jgi:solute carrier family 31 (copper transporter), member 1
MDMNMSMMNMTLNMTASGLMPSSMMAMIFYNSHTTPLYSLQFAPTTTGGYAGACIFLIILSMTFRGLFAFKHLLEARWANQAWNRRYIVVADKTPMSERLERDPDAKHAVLSANGVEEHVRVVQQANHGVQPWRFSVDLPRAALVTVMAGVGYLL